MAIRAPLLAGFLLVVSFPVAGVAAHPPVTVLPPPSPERLFTPPTMRPAEEVQRSPAVASDGTGWFAVWSDSRYRNAGVNNGGDIFGTPIATDGTPLRPEGIPISPTFSADVDPAIAWNGENYVVAWGSPLGLLTALITPDGVVQRSGIAIEPLQLFHVADHVALAWNGERFLVLWRESAHPTHRVRAAFLDRDGSLAGNPFLISPSSAKQMSPAVATLGGAFTVAWREESDETTAIVTTSVDADGSVGSPHVVTTFRPYTSWSSWVPSPLLPGPAIAADGASTLLVWSDPRVRAVSLGARGEVLGDIRTIVEPDEGFAGAPTVVAAGGEWLIGFTLGTTEAPDPFVVRVTRDATGSLRALPSPTGTRVALSAAGSRVLAVWEDWRPPLAETDIYGVVVDVATALPLTEERLISLGLPHQTDVRIVRHGDGYLVVWRERDLLLLALVNDAGDFVAPPRVIADESWHPAVASNGSVAAVAWYRHDGQDVEVQIVRIGRDGEALDHEPITIADAWLPAVATDGEDFLVVWVQPERASRVRAAGLTASGVMLLLASELPLANPAAQPLDPAAAWTGEHYVVVWSERSPCVAGHCPSDIYAMPAGRTGAPLAAQPRAITSTPSRTDEESPRIACSGVDCFVTWNVLSWSGAARITESGELLGDALPRIPGSLMDWPSRPDAFVIWDGERYVLSAAPVAPIGDRRYLRIFPEHLVPIPESHEGFVTRLFVEIVTHAARRRAVRVP